MWSLQIQGKGWVTRSKRPPAMSPRVDKKSAIPKLQTNFDVYPDNMDGHQLFGIVREIAKMNKYYWGLILGISWDPWTNITFTSWSGPAKALGRMNTFWLSIHKPSGIPRVSNLKWLAPSSWVLIAKVRGGFTHRLWSCLGWHGLCGLRIFYRGHGMTITDW